MVLAKWGFVVFVNLRLKANVCWGGAEREFKWECFFVMFLTALTWKRVMQGSDGLSLYRESK